MSDDRERIKQRIALYEAELELCDSEDEPLISERAYVSDVNALLAFLRDRDEEIARLREALKPIEEVWKWLNKKSLDDQRVLKEYSVMYQAIKLAMEIMKEGKA